MAADFDATGAPGSASPGAESLFGSLKAVLGELPGLVSDRVHLLALELRRAGQALALMVAFVAAAAVLLCTAWLALWAGLAAAAIQAGVPWGWVMIIVLAINLAAAFYALQRARVLSHLLTLPATMRRLTVTPTASSAVAHTPAAASAAEGGMPAGRAWSGTLSTGAGAPSSGAVH